MDKTDIRGLFKKAYPTKEEEIEAIKKWAPGFDLGVEFFCAKEVAIDNWWHESYYNEQAIKDYLDTLCLD